MRYGKWSMSSIIQTLRLGATFREEYSTVETDVLAKENSYLPDPKSQEMMIEVAGGQTPCPTPTRPAGLLRRGGCVFHPGLLPDWTHVDPTQRPLTVNFQVSLPCFQCFQLVSF